MSDDRTDPGNQQGNGTSGTARSDVHDLDSIEADLAAVEVALNRLDAGTYWTDEVTGEPIADRLLEQDPLLRRLPR